MSNLAKGIIDSLDNQQGEIDHAHHTRELHKHAASIVNRTLAGEPHTAEVLSAFEHAYMLMKSLGLTDTVGEEPTAEPTHEEIANNVDLPEGHRYVTLRQEQMESKYTGGKRKLHGFVESYESIEEAYAAAKTWAKLPVIIAEVSSNEDGMFGQMRYMFTAQAQADRGSGITIVDRNPDCW